MVLESTAPVDTVVMDGERRGWELEVSTEVSTCRQHGGQHGA